jgi:hypothetical protein
MRTHSGYVQPEMGTKAGLGLAPHPDPTVAVTVEAAMVSPGIVGIAPVAVLQSHRVRVKSQCRKANTTERKESHYLGRLAAWQSAEGQIQRTAEDKVLMESNGTHRHVRADEGRRRPGVESELRCIDDPISASSGRGGEG